MRQKRIKSYRKVMGLYTQPPFGFREPYQLLADAAFVKSCVQQKLDIMARLQDVLQGTVKPMITQCCMQALYDAGEEAQPAVEAAKLFERRKCNHFKARKEDECMTAMAGDENKNRYVFATQSLELRQTLRRVPGSPIIYIARSVMLLETPSDQTLAKKHKAESAKLHVSAEELAQITGQPIPSTSAAASDASDAEPEAAEGGADEPPAKKKKKQRGPKGPNPLSVKKKKGAAGEGAKQTGRPAKRARDGEDASERGESREERDAKRKRAEEGKVVSMAARGRAADGGERKKRKRRRKGGAAGEGAAGEGGAAGKGGAGGGEE
ncbi:hypothetical protein JCM8097_006534 [Rhodosporidiobolus ruineniae]